MFLIALHCTVNKVKLGSEKMQRATSHTIQLESIMHDFALIANFCTVIHTILLHYSFAYHLCDYWGTVNSESPNVPNLYLVIQKDIVICTRFCT